MRYQEYTHICTVDVPRSTQIMCPSALNTKHFLYTCIANAIAISLILELFHEDNN